jgi:hypothetical protein
MLQNWHLRSRAHRCARTSEAFVDGQPIYTAIYFDRGTGEYERRDVSVEGWAEELAERNPYSYWKSAYQKTVAEEKPEISGRENPAELLRRLVEEDQPETENARYILAVMLERKRQLAETAVKEDETGKLRFYENKKTGDVFLIRDPGLRLDEIERVQQQVAELLGFAQPQGHPRPASESAPP